ncbi:TPA: DUF11 domain-containing protein, partial [Bacillus cereus]|nr:DUF11 domain-containing protein [Bacillus cereus]
MQKYFGFKKYGKRFKQTIVSLLAFLLVFSGVAPSTVLQTVHAETASSTNTAVTQAKNKMLTYKFDNFSSNAVSQLFTLNDAAEVPGGANFIRLTPASTLKCGAAFTKNEICPKNNYSFSTAFSFKMSNPSPSGASDGLTFTIQGGTSSSHTNGGSLNFYGIKPSFTVKYDTFLNTDYRDPSANYIGLAKNGNPVNQPGWYTDLNQYNTNNGTNYALSNGTQYYTWIDYDGLSQNVRVLLGTSPDRASAKKVLDVGNIDLGTIFNGQPYHAGFTASTGSPNYETHDINSWYFVNDYVPIETLNPNNDYKQAPSSVKVTTGPSDKPGVYDVTAILQDPLGNPVAGASLDNLTATNGQLTGPNGESVTDLVSDADGKIHAVLKNFDHSKDNTVSATVGCATDSKMISAANQPPTAPDDEKTIAVNTKVSGQVKGTDPDGDSLTYHAGKQPSNGTVVVNEDGTWTYTPGKDYVGDDSFTVMVDDGHGGTTEATIVIHVKSTLPTNSCGPLGRVALINGSFEEPTARMPGDKGSPGSEHAWQYFLESEVPGWKTSASDKFIQIMKNEFIYNGMQINPPNGNQYAELNAEQVSALYQDVKTIPGQTIYWRLAHKGLLGVDTMSVQIGSTNIPIKDLPVIQEVSTGNTEWKYYSGTYTVPADQTTTRFAFNSVNAAGGNQRYGNLLDDIFLGTEPCVSATKSVDKEGQVKAGDELTYKVKVKNDGGDIAAKSIFTDAIPVGTEYVPGSIQVTKNAKTDSITDGKDTDSGYYQDGKVTVDLGDLPNTDILPDGVTVQFKVKALSSDVKQQIKNKANVAYKNLLVNKDQSVDTNEVVNEVEPEPETPTPPANSCGHLSRVALINGSFEEGPARGSYDIAYPFMFLESEVPGWKTTDDSQGPKIIEIWDYKQDYPINNVRNQPPPADGNRYAELNAYENGMLYQDVKTSPGQTIYWRLSHKGLFGADTMQLRIGAATNNPYDTVVQQQMSDGNTGWGTYAGTYKVPEGQTVTRFGFEAVSTSNGSIGHGNHLDNIFLGTEPCVSATKSVSPEGQVKVGDELTYNVKVKNDGGDIAANSIFTDAIPAGTEYVPGSIQVTKNAKTDSITDGKDTDSGYYQDGKVTVDLGDLPNTDILPDGVTVQFKVKVLSGYVNQQIKNKANVAYKNLLVNKDQSVDTNEVVNTVIVKDAKVESKKIAKNLQDKNTEVGDEIEYTIQMRNTVSDSIVKNAVIEDQLPEG